jgi:hypothetical protein
MQIQHEKTMYLQPNQTKTSQNQPFQADLRRMKSPTQAQKQENNQKQAQLRNEGGIDCKSNRDSIAHRLNRKQATPKKTQLTREKLLPQNKKKEL